MRLAAVLFVALFAFSAQAQAAATGRTIVYQFGFNTKVAKEGQGTGTTTIRIIGPAADGGLMIGGTDYWWNTARARAENVCEVYPNGKVNCATRPYAISPMQLTLFPLFGKDFFKGLKHDPHAKWTQSFSVHAAILPGSTNPFAGDPFTWNAVYNMTAKGQMADLNGVIHITENGTLDQQGGRYKQATSKAQIAWDTQAHVPVFVSEVRTHLPQKSVYNNDLIEVQAISDSANPH